MDNHHHPNKQQHNNTIISYYYYYYYHNNIYSPLCYCINKTAESTFVVNQNNQLFRTKSVPKSIEYKLKVFVNLVPIKYYNPSTMVLGTSKRHHNNNSRPSSKHRQKQKRYPKSRGSYAKGEVDKYHDSENSSIQGNVNDENDKLQGSTKKYYSSKDQSESYRRRKSIKHSHRRGQVNSRPQNKHRKKHYNSRRSHTNASTLDTRRKHCKDPKSLLNHNVEEKFDSILAEVGTESVSKERQNKTKFENSNNFSYFSLSPETVIFGKTEQTPFMPLSKTPTISRIKQMEGVFNISPASIIFKMQSRSQVFEQFRCAK